MVLALAGCRQVLGLSDPAPLPDGAVALPVHGQHHVVGYLNDMTGTPLPEDVAFEAVTGSVIHADSSIETLALDDNGNFAFVADQLPYRLVFVDDGATPLEYQLTSQTIDLGVPVMRRYPMQPTPPATRLDLAMVNEQPGGSPLVQSTGLWASLSPSGQSQSELLVDWGTAYTGLLDASEYDALYVTMMASSGNGYTSITSACTTNVTLVGGTTTFGECDLAPTLPDHCTRVVSPGAAEIERLVGAVADGPEYRDATSGWQLLAAPLGDPRAWGLRLAYDDSGTVHDADVQVEYTDPFNGHLALAALSTAVSRPVGVTNVYATTTHFARAQDSCSSPTQIMSAVAIAGMPTLGGTQLVRDDLVVGLPASGLAELTWPIASPGTVDFYSVELFEIDLATGAFTGVRNYMTVEPHVAIDPALFAASTHYVVLIFAFAGYPDASTGNLTRIGFPEIGYATSAVTSGTFTVSAP